MVPTETKQDSLSRQVVNNGKANDVVTGEFVGGQGGVCGWTWGEWTNFTLRPGVHLFLAVDNPLLIFDTSWLTPLSHGVSIIGKKNAK